MNTSINTLNRETMNADQLLQELLDHSLGQQLETRQYPTRHNNADYDLGIWSLHYHLELNPQDTQSRHELARCYHDHREHKQAVREYRKLMCLDPHCYDARLELADCYIALEMWHEAACELRLLTLVSSYAPEAWQRLTGLAMRMPRIFDQTEADTQQQVWEMLQQ